MGVTTDGVAPEAVKATGTDDKPEKAEKPRVKVTTLEKALAAAITSALLAVGGVVANGSSKLDDLHDDVQKLDTRLREIEKASAVDSTRLQAIDERLKRMEDHR